MDPKEAVREQSLDIWICHHFRVLPTSPDFKQLTDNQKILLFYGWTELPTSDQIKEMYDSREEDPVITKTDADNFRKRGYTEKQIAFMKEQLENAGYRQPN